MLSETLQRPDALARLLQAKELSDRKRYAEKSRIVRGMIEEAPDDWMVDSMQGRFVGLTHKPTGFRIHLPAGQAHIPNAEAQA